MSESKLITSKQFYLICDDNSWIFDFIQKSLAACGHKSFTKISSDIKVKDYIENLKEADRIILYWEGKHRSGEGILEEFKELSKHISLDSKFIILTTDAKREDELYFSELELTKVINLRNRQDFLQKSSAELKKYIKAESCLIGIDKAWSNIYAYLSTIKPKEPDQKALLKLEESIQKIVDHTKVKSCQFYHLTGCISQLRGDSKNAEGFWEKAIEQNPHYFKAYDDLISLYKEQSLYQKAIDLTHKLYALNKKNISRMVSLGEIYDAMGESQKAEHYYNLALSKDKNISSAINGLAKIRFRQGNLEEARSLLKESNLSQVMASNLNKEGIKLVKLGKYEDALKHYSKAQYVLPMQDKGPLLFYNMGLCYSKWGKLDDALDFLRIALIKDPEYEKAKNLFGKVEISLKDGVAA